MKLTITYARDRRSETIEAESVLPPTAASDCYTVVLVDGGKLWLEPNAVESLWACPTDRK